MTLTIITTVLEGRRPLTVSAAATAGDWHRRQRDLVAASLIAVPAVRRPTHRRWA